MVPFVYWLVKLASHEVESLPCSENLQEYAANSTRDDIKAMCEYHTTHTDADREDYNEFSLPPYGFMPVEVLALLKVRDISVDSVWDIHPLLQSRVCVVPNEITMPRPSILEEFHGRWEEFYKHTA